jgi:hypothetical protein
LHFGFEKDLTSPIDTLDKKHKDFIGATTVALFRAKFKAKEI